MKSPLISDFHADGTYETMLDGIRRQVVAMGLAPVWKDVYTAYLLATIKHETAGTFRPIEEFGGASKRYAPYYGRGFVQLTWLKNYQKYNDLLHLDMVANPSIALRSDVSLFILVHGCYYGIFTGRGFNDYHNPSADDFNDMRAIVNGTDRAELIASFAKKFLADIQGKKLAPMETPKVEPRKPSEVLTARKETSHVVFRSPIEVTSTPILTSPPSDTSLKAFLLALGKLMEMFGHEKDSK